ncbi:hypothetical protein EQZ23_07060 [Sphingomonas sp. UV9]|uniref:hypothetical protein n=1 Tax=Sphingomonas sp. UV9 TaxID=1851410 RepID=UPI000FFBFACC|nr:hypothetical protein [Sphingomonas sp. UV9]RXD04891.1 hypothetical protein EQZ23_07060 [Sphingomonas sp. UV9]
MKIRGIPTCETVADVIVADTRTALTAIDDALLAQTQLFVTTLQAAKAHPVRVGTTQRLYASFDQSVQGILASRKAMAESIGALHAIARSKGVEERLEGCADGFPQSFVVPIGRSESVETAAAL